MYYYRRVLSFYHPSLFKYVTLAFLLPMATPVNYYNLFDENRATALDPVKLIDLVLQEEETQKCDRMADVKPVVECTAEPTKSQDRDWKIINTHELFIKEQRGIVNSSVTQMNSNAEKEQNDRDKKDDAIKARKVWSRWSKWSKCSVTCGEGMIARRRVCVSGRCASGEAEEQRRPCKHAPCAYQDTTADVPLLVELHDLD